MPYVVDFGEVSTQGLETSPVAGALAGLRANEARYYMNKHRHAFTTVPAQTDGRRTLDYVSRVLREERGIALSATALETAMFELENTRIAYVFYEDGLVVNVMYALDNPKQRAVGLKLSDGMEVPAELEGRFKFARQKSRLAGTIRGSFFLVKGEYAP
ncbi:MAG: phage tail protein [Clostridiales bacterium]|nr:phage tail protein [Clostridiales bacterium]